MRRRMGNGYIGYGRRNENEMNVIRLRR